MRLRSRLPALVAAGLVLAAIVGLVARADALLDLLAGSVARADAAVGNRLSAAGVLAYWDFDEVRPRNRVSGRDVETGGTRIVRGRYGSARAFRPGRQSFVRTDVPLPALGPQFTFSCWVRFPEKVRNQQIFQYLAVAGGKLVLRLPGQKPLAWPIEAAPGRFRHVAFTVDEAAGTARLYIDGEPQGSLALQPLVHKSLQLCFGQDRWTPPAAFALDEVSVWARALSPEEVRALARQRRSLGTSRAFARLAALYAARTFRDTYGALLLAVDLFNPLLHESRIYSAGLPSYALELSRNDVRHFNAWFNDTADNGLNAPATSDKRKVDLLVRGRRRSAVMELVAGRQTGPETSSKRTFTLELLDADGEPERKLLLRPVEGAPYLLDALAAKLARDSGLPPVAPEIVAVSTNGSFDGLYLAADLSGDKGSFWRGEAEQWRELITRLPFFRDQALAEFDRIAGRLKAPLCSDRKSPLTSREIVHEIRRQRRLLEDAALDRTPRSDEALVARVADFVREEIFLGDNPHA
ncbi:MAG TPA: LamG domain-containing protein, partial [bacterium]